MKRNYLSPQVEVASAEVVSMVAESLPISSEITVDGGDALTKESDWNIWDEE